MNTLKKETKVVIVGIELYEHPNLPNIDGPAIDACKFANRIASKGIPEANIELLIKPLPKNLNDCKDIAGSIAYKEPNNKNIHDILFEQLPSRSSELFILYWGGHGLMNDTQERVLFCSDAKETFEANLNLSSLMQSMATDHYANHPVQQFIVDACSGFQDISKRMSTLPRSVPGIGQQQPHMKQFGLFASSRGEFARNDNALRTGVFSAHLFSSLDAFDDEWPISLRPIWKNAFDKCKQEMNDLAGASQVPIQTIYMGAGGDSESDWIEPIETQRIVERININRIGPENQNNNIEVTDDGPIQRFFKRSRLAFEDAGRVSGVVDNGQDTAFSSGLYVHRDLEKPLLDLLRNRQPDPILITGRPGSGKTSLLWGLGSALTASDDGEVLFVRAPWLIRNVSNADAFDPLTVTNAARKLLAEGRLVTVLIDTADTLTSDEAALATLEHLVELLVLSGISVVVTSRQEEAKSMPSAWLRRIGEASQSTELGDYSTLPSPFEGTSEFERAVAAHARSYRDRKGFSVDVLVHQLANAVARRQSMELICRRPLFLRMLFHLYAPNSVPENLSVTSLYEKYWEDRVVDDRRNLVKRSPATGAPDLSNSVAIVAIEMLRQGSPELIINSISIPSKVHRKDFETDLLLMITRGIGQISGNTFRFFHQTFFEFSSAKGLLEMAGIGALRLLIRRSKIHPGDYFLLAVLEQTWLCAWQFSDLRFLAQNEAIDILRRSITSAFPSHQNSDSEVVEKNSVPFSLRQTVMSVISQVPVGSTELFRLFEEQISSGPEDLARHALKMLPSPGRAIGNVELKAVQHCFGRWDRTRSEAVEVFGRLVDADPDLAVGMLPTLSIVPEETFGINEKDHDFIGKQLTPIILRLFPYSPELVLKTLERIIYHAHRNGRGSLSAEIFDGLAQFDGNLTAIITQWCDDIIPTIKSNRLIKTHLLRIHRNRIDVQICQNGWNYVEGLFADSFARLLVGEVLEPSLLNTVGGVLAAIDDRTPDANIDGILETLLSCDDPLIHSHLHQGLLVPLIRHASKATQSRLATILSAGLPAPRRAPEGAKSRWADTLRRSLEHEELPESCTAEVCEESIKLLSIRDGLGVDFIWLAPDYLLSLAIKASAGGSPSALLALNAAASGSHAIQPSALRYISQRARNPKGTVAEVSTVIDLVLQLRDYQAMLHIVELKNGFSLFLSSNDRERLSELIHSGLQDSDKTRKKIAARLYSASVRHSFVPLPLRVDLEYFFESHLNIENSAVEILNYGFERGQYPAEEVLPMMEVFIAKFKDIDNQSPSVALRDASRLRLKVLSVTLASHRWSDLLDLVFTDPMDSRCAAIVSNFVNDDRRQTDRADLASKIEFIIQFGSRLASINISKGFSRDISIAWVPILKKVLRSVGPDLHFKILQALTSLEQRFAAEVANLVVLVEPEVRALGRTLIESQDLHADVRERLTAVLRDTPQLTGTSTWLELDDDLQFVIAGN